jgi:hypothetical protein
MGVKDSLERFMRGRYGQDELSRVLTISALALYIVSVLTKWIVLSSLSMVVLIFCLFRSFSRNTANRAKEAELYFKLKDKASGFFAGPIGRLRQSKDYRFFKCPSCGQWCRVPRGKGRIIMTCSRCSTKFPGKT